MAPNFHSTKFFKSHDQYEKLIYKIFVLLIESIDISRIFFGTSLTLVTQGCSSISSHSLCSPKSSSFLRCMAKGCDFTRALAIVFQSIPAHNHPDTCDSLHVTNLVSDVVPSCRIRQCFIWGLAQGIALI